MPYPFENIGGMMHLDLGQDQAIRSVCEGKKTLAIFPTGAGKSLCYQVPAVSFEGLVCIASVALMEDQVQQLQEEESSWLILRPN